MKDKLAKIKNKIFKKEFILQTFYISLLLVCFFFLYINNTTIQYWVNGFSQMYETDLQVYFLDVGQGNSTLIIFPNNMAMLVDTGTQNSQKQLVKSVEHILHKNNIDEIEYLVLTHSDEDHVGGTQAVLEKFDVCNILRPKILSYLESSYKGYGYVDTKIYAEIITAVYEEPNCTKSFVEDDILKFGEVTVEIFSCNLDNYSDTNSYSPFILIEYKQKSFLLTGDTTSKRETEFLNDLENENRNLDIDYLLVSHHGSKYSTTAKFLNAIMPDYAFVSCEEDYYPSVEVKQRLNDVGIKEIYTTREVSTIAVGIESDSTHLVLCFDSYLDLPFVFVCMSIVCFVFLKFPTPRKLRFREKNQIFLKKMAKKAG